MPSGKTTCWTLIRGAADGDPEARRDFAVRYEGVVRAYLGARWKHAPLRAEIDDATQEVFLACFKEQGALVRADPERGKSFGAFLYGVVRNIARRHEERKARTERQAEDAWIKGIESREDSFSEIFEREWARALVQQAMRHQAQQARSAGEEVVQRVELLRLRFQHDQPIREIAREWDADPAHLHREYARARRDFASALFDVVQEHTGGTPREIRATCARLVASLH